MKKPILKRIGAGVLSFCLVTGCIPVFSVNKAKAEDTQEEQNQIIIDGDDIKADNVNGLTFKGFGLLSGNSTSDLLMDYKAENPEAYAELLQILFGGEYPIMNHVKLEMGNDRNNSTGPESATKRYKEEKANVLRNPGWQLAADAKKINPNIKVSILRWNKPEWVQTDEDIYTWYKETILDAYEKYGYMVDYINPNVNEHWGGDNDVAFTKKFAKWISQETKETMPDEKALALFQKIKLIVSDEASTVSRKVVRSMKSDQEFYDAVDVVGYHYSPNDDSDGGMKWLADSEDKEVWNSEAQATFSNSAFRPSNNVKDPSVAGTGLGGTGSALEMGNTFIKGFVKSRRSHVIYQPAVGSFYEGGQFSFKELVSARDPWSGWIHYDAGLLVLAHLSKFAVTGWENEDNTAGIWRGIPEASKSTAEGINPVAGRNGGPNYMTLAAPTKDDFSTLIVNDSEYEMIYTLQTQNMNLENKQKLEVWETRAADDGAFNENYMKCVDTLSADEDGIYMVTVKPYSVVTVTSLNVSDSKEHTDALPVEGERTVLDTDSSGAQQDTDSNYLYADDFEYRDKTVPVLDGNGGFTDETENYIESRGGDTGAMARYTHTINGAFEVYRNSTGNYVLRQQLDRDAYGVGGAWNDGDPVTLIGDFRWMNYMVSTDVLFETESNQPYAAIGIRQTGSSHIITDSSGYTFKISKSGNWALYRKDQEVKSGDLEEETGFRGGKNQWNNIKLRGEGDTITAYVNNVLVCTYVDDTPITSGRVALGSGYTFTQFDNLRVTKISGTVPYYSELLDNMETYDLSPQKNPKLQYNDKWNHRNGQGMYVYQRSNSVSTEAGATMSYTFTGTGLEILGANSEVFTLSTVVDGKEAVTETSQKADNMNMTYRIQGLDYGQHTVTVEVQQKDFTIDTIGILGDIYQGEDDTPVPLPGGPILPEDPSDPVVPDDPSDPDTPITPQQPTPQLPSTSPTPTPSPARKLTNGSTFKVKNAIYVVTDIDKNTVEYKMPSKATVKSVTIPNTLQLTVDGKTTKMKVTGISANAFAKCSKLQKVIIGKNVRSIGKRAFLNCKKLNKITIKSTQLKSVGKDAIKGIHKKAVIRCGKKKKAYQKLFVKKTGYKKSMKIKK